jgi:hypothetical protein
VHATAERQSVRKGYVLKYEVSHANATYLLAPTQLLPPRLFSLPQSQSLSLSLSLPLVAAPSSAEGSGRAGRGPQLGTHS